MQRACENSIWRKSEYNLSGKKVYVAGHNGMVGSSLLRRLSREGCTVLTADRNDLDCRDQAAVQNRMHENKPDVVVIAAAKVGGIGANNANPAAFFYDNMMIATNLIHASYEAGVKRLLFLGSSCIYPRAAEQPIAEGALLSGALEPTNEAYALAKIGGLKMVEYYRRQYGCDFISAMPCNLYGVGDRYHADDSHVIPALIMKAHQAKVNGAAEIVVWGSGTPLREFLYVDDLADALVMLLQNYNGDAHINVGSGQEISIKDLAHLICDVVGFEGKIVFDASKPDGTPRKILDSDLIAQSGWSAKTQLKDGLCAAYKDYLTRYGA